MPAKRLVPLVLAGALLAALWLAAVAQALPSRMIGLGAGASKNTLFSFSGEDLNTVTVVPVTGLGAANLVGISFRPADGELYGFGINGNTWTVFALDLSAGVATPVGSATPPVGTIAAAPPYGVDFNPVSDRLRLVDGLESTGTNINNFRVNPNNAALAAVDTKLNYSLLPGGEGGTRPLATIAYDRNVTGATATTAFGIVAGGNDSLVRLGGVDAMPSPNTGALAFIGPLGVDTTFNAGLDIDPATGEAYAILQVAGESGLYRIDLATGAATLVGKIAGGGFSFGSLAIVPPPPPSPPETPVAPAAPAPPSSSPPPTSGPPAPLLLTLQIKPAAFVPAGSGPPIAAGKKAVGGTKVSYSLSASTTVSFRVEAKVRGKFRPLKGAFKHTGLTGANSFRFSGRLGGKTLVEGRYRLTGTVGTGSRSASFRVKSPQLPH